MLFVLACTTLWEKKLQMRLEKQISQEECYTT